MHHRRALAAGAVAAFCVPHLCAAQDGERQPGFDFGLDVVYLLSDEVGFDGGSQLDFDDDIGLTILFGYRFNPRFELQFSMDWNETDYSGVLQSASFPGLSADIRGDMETFTPRVNAIYNFRNAPVTPYVIGGVGWSFIDTNIPTGQVSVGCWWDPWWGQVCTPYQPTLSVDGFTYQAGAGVRWDISGQYSMRLSYEKMWFDLGEATSTPDFDRFKLGFAFQY